jgi:hypothetical protein
LFTEEGKLKTVVGWAYVAEVMLNEEAGVVAVNEPPFRL